MDITVIDDRIELNGHILAVITNNAPASLSVWFREFLNGRDEKDLDAGSYQSGYETGQEEGYDEGFHSRDCAFREIEDELSDLIETADKLSSALQGVDLPEGAAEALEDLERLT